VCAKLGSVIKSNRRKTLPSDITPTGDICRNLGCELSADLANTALSRLTSLSASCFRVRDIVQKFRHRTDP
jgi:hypothetical protein